MTRAEIVAALADLDMHGCDGCGCQCCYWLEELLALTAPLPDYPERRV